jgi:hypothetical protein
MSKNVCFNKNIFIIGIIIIIIIFLLFSYFINFNYNYNNEAKIHNLINKKILNIKDKIINNITNTNNNYYDDINDKVIKEDLKEEEIINNHIPKKTQELYLKTELAEQLDSQNETVKEYEPVREYKIVQKPKQVYKPVQEPVQEPVQDIDTNTKVNFKNNINDRINDREELIKYKINAEVQQRDLNVLLNPIYPPLARVERPIFDNLIKMNFGQTTRGSEDTFRLMGYLVNSNKNDMDMGGNLWKLFGRQSYKGSSVGEFYVSPVNDHKSDMKIYLKNDMMPKDKIRDIYALPTEIYFNSPFFSKNAYTINELPKSDLNSNYL